MPGPGQYVPDPTAGISDRKELPQAKIVRRRRNFKQLPCPHCGKASYSQHRCRTCNKFFDADTSEYSLPKARYTHRVMSLAVRLVVEDGLPYQAASWHLWRDHRVFVPFATLQNWVEAGGEKGGPTDVDELSRLGPRGLLRVHRHR